MKKYITIFGFFALFLLGSQFAGAQEQIKKSPRVSPEVVAKQKTYEMHEMLDLSGDQQGQVFKVLVNAEQNLQAINANGGDATSIQKRKEEILKYVDTKLSSILTADQFKKYKLAEQESLSKKSAETIKKRG